MKKKILLMIGMFLFITNVKALTFNVNLTDIEDKGSDSLGSITSIDVANKELNVLFQEAGDEVNFELTITNSGDRAGTLRSISITSTNDKIKYTTNLPTNGLAINGNDTNKVTINAKVLEGITKGTSTSTIKITYNYDEGSCPEGEILSEDESMCLCPNGKVRNEKGLCEEPEEDPECEDDEIYNETKKICEKKIVPVTPSNPKTLDNIILITLLFIVSGLGIYAVMFKKLKTDKKKIIVGVIIGVITLGASFTVLAGVFGLENLLGAIVNPITKSKEIIVTVNEEVDIVETWDGECSLETSQLTSSNIFEGGSGTESDPYQIKTAEQLSCFAASVNNGTTYEGKFVKQINNIVLNDDLNDNITARTTTGLHSWTPAGYNYSDQDWNNFSTEFAGTYDGDNYKISGLYIVKNPENRRNDMKGLFGYAVNATFKNMVLADVYINDIDQNDAEYYSNTGALLGLGYKNLTINNIKTYGNAIIGGNSAGIVSSYDGNNEGIIDIENTENNINISAAKNTAGIVRSIEKVKQSDEPNIIFRNVTNKGNITSAYLTNTSFSSESGGISGYINALRNGVLICDNCANTGKFTNLKGSSVGGLFGNTLVVSLTASNSYNTGNWVNCNISQSGGLFGTVNGTVTADNLYNSGNIQMVETNSSTILYVGGIFGHHGTGEFTITNSFNTGNIEGYIGYGAGLVSNGGSGSNMSMENCYNRGSIRGYGYTGGLVGSFRGSITKSYNKGDITSYGGPRTGGLVGWGDASIYNSYNEGNILVTSHGGQHGGLCAADCPVIKNSYNRGNVTAKYKGTQIAGIAGQGSNIINVYNSGNVTYENLENDGDSVIIAGISGTSGGTNVYNLGKVTANAGVGGNYLLCGIAQYPGDKNVNAGNVSLIVTKPLTSASSFVLYGIGYGSTNNSFNTGTLSIDDSSASISSDGFNHSILIGQITFSSGSGNKWNTDPSGHATGCFGVDSSCTSSADQAVGTYTSEATPDILSVINGDNAFNSQLDEDGLPTLKIFNE